MQQKPDKDGWGHPVGGREKARRKTAAANTGLLHMQASYPPSYGWGIEELVQAAQETCARVSGKAKCSVCSLQSRTVNAACRSLKVRKLVQLKAALGLQKYILGNGQALKKFRFE